MRAQGRLPEARHPNGFSRWDEVEGEWIEDSDNDEPAPTGSIEGGNWDVPELMPELSHDNDDEAVFEPARDDDLWQPLMLSLLDMPILNDAPSVPSVSLPTDALMGSIDVAHAYMHCELDEEQSYVDGPAQAVAPPTQQGSTRTTASPTFSRACSMPSTGHCFGQPRPLSRQSTRWRTWLGTRGPGTRKAQAPTTKAPKGGQIRFKRRLHPSPSLPPRQGR